MKDLVANYILSNPTSKAYWIDGGYEVGAEKQYVVAACGHRQINSLSWVDDSMGPRRTIGAVTGVNLGEFFSFFEGDLAFTANTYRKVKDLKLWQDVYGVKELMYEALSKRDGLYAKTEKSAFCRVCGLMLPLKVLTVDHQKAQTADVTAAILRVFRGLGLTKAGARGKKNTEAIAAWAAKVGGDTAPKGGTMAERTTLNVFGGIYYSVFKAAGALPALSTACTHHYLNLRPVCGPCNSRLRDQNIF